MYSVEFNTDTFSPALLNLAVGLSDMSPVMVKIGRYLTESTKERFKVGKAPDGSAWAPKSATTLAAYGARKSNRVDARPLFGPTGLLSQQISYDADSSSVSWGSNRIYAAVMQFGAAKGAFGKTSRGASIPWGAIPARPFIGVSAEDETQLVNIVSEYLEQAARGTP